MQGSSGKKWYWPEYPRMGVRGVQNQSPQQFPRLTEQIKRRHAGRDATGHFLAGLVRAAEVVREELVDVANVEHLVMDDNLFQLVEDVVLLRYGQ